MNVPSGPLANLPYFISWGGDAALVLARRAFDEVLGSDFSGKRVLEIGAGGGKMSSLFGLLGAEVVGIDIAPDFPNRALAESKKWQVSNQMDFRMGTTALDGLPNDSFDLVFCKSVLLYFDDLESYMRKVAPKLKPDGRICFLENRCRNFVERFLRYLVHLVQGRQNYYYMTPERIAAIGKVFDLEEVQMVMNPIFHVRTTPGWYLIAGRKRKFVSEIK